MAGKKTFARLVFLAIISAIIAPLAINGLALVPTLASPSRQTLSAETTTNDTGFTRAEMEARILAVTVRIEMHTWATFGGHHKAITTYSHATILDGKYLVTHNHFKYDLAEQVPEFGEARGYTGISLRTTQGNLVLENAPLASFRVVIEDPQTLVLAFIDEQGRGLFESAGLPSAETIDWQTIDLREGMPLAQVDWDGESAHVDWVPFEAMNLGEVEHIEVNNFPRKGSSGSGVFWNGYHLGNTWAENIEEDADSGEITRRYSIIALNSDAVIELAQSEK